MSRDGIDLAVGCSQPVDGSAVQYGCADQSGELGHAGDDGLRVVSQLEQHEGDQRHSDLIRTAFSLVP